jgi:hypothetical protein
MDKLNSSMMSKSGRLDLPPPKENLEEYLFLIFLF